MSSLENLYHLADKAIEEGEIEKAKTLLEQILADEPQYAQAHNHLGWLYRNKFGDIQRAEYHYKLANQFNPNYNSPVINYIYLLRDSGRLDELEQWLIKAEKINTLNRCTYYDELATFYEMKGDFRQAIQNYKQAIKFTINNSYLDDLKSHIKRCNEKSDFFESNRFKRALKIILGSE